MEERRSHSP